MTTHPSVLQLLSTKPHQPLLMAAPMVRATFDDRKTQTRRVAGLHEDYLSDLVKRCPYGQPGDLLWVRETWKCEELASGLDGVRFAADNAFREIENTQAAASAWLEARREGDKWRPSIFMPKWACRLVLELTAIRVERLQSISLEDAEAEGVTVFDATRQNGDVSAFTQLWNSINAKRGFGWDLNPWVWALTFKVAWKGFAA